jgi:hypothetical protein
MCSKNLRELDPRFLIDLVFLTTSLIIYFITFLNLLKGHFVIVISKAVLFIERIVKRMLRKKAFLNYTIL